MNIEKLVFKQVKYLQNAVLGFSGVQHLIQGQPLLVTQYHLDMVTGQSHLEHFAGRHFAGRLAVQLAYGRNEVDEFGFL